MGDREGLPLLQPSGLPGGAGGGCGFALGSRALSDESAQWLGSQASVLRAGHPCELRRAVLLLPASGPLSLGSGHSKTRSLPESHWSDLAR